MCSRQSSPEDWQWYPGQRWGSSIALAVTSASLTWVVPLDARLITLEGGTWLYAVKRRMPETERRHVGRFAAGPEASIGCQSTPVAGSDSTTGGFRVTLLTNLTEWAGSFYNVPSQYNCRTSFVIHPAFPLHPTQVQPLRPSPIRAGAFPYILFVERCLLRNHHFSSR